MNWIEYLKIALEIIRLITGQIDKESKQPGFGPADGQAPENIATKLDELAARIRSGE